MWHKAAVKGSLGHMGQEAEQGSGELCSGGTLVEGEMVCIIVSTLALGRAWSIAFHRGVCEAMVGMK